MNPKLNRRFYGLLKQHGITAQKADLVSAATNGRTTKSSEMTDGEAAALIEKLQADAPLSTYNQMLTTWATDNKERLIYGLFRQLNFTLPTGKPDYDRINNFCVHSSAAKVPLKAMDYDQRHALEKQLRQVVRAAKNLSKS